MGAPTFDLQSHSTCSDGALPPARWSRPRPPRAWSCWRSPTMTRWTASTRRCEAARGSRPPRGRRRPSSPRSTATARTSTSSATASTTTPRACSRRWPSSAPIAAPARSPHGRRAARLRAAARACRERSRSAVPISLRLRSTIPPTGCASQREEIVNASQLLEAYLIPGAPAYRRRTHADRRRGDRARPRRRRGRGLGAPVLGRRRGRRGRCESIDRFAALGPRRRRGLLHHATTPSRPP